jgi:hypothetical protein
VSCLGSVLDILMSWLLSVLKVPGILNVPFTQEALSKEEESVINTETDTMAKSDQPQSFFKAQARKRKPCISKSYIHIFALVDYQNMLFHV